MELGGLAKHDKERSKYRGKYENKLEVNILIISEMNKKCVDDAS